MKKTVSLILLTAVLILAAGCLEMTYAEDTLIQRPHTPGLSKSDHCHAYITKNELGPWYYDYINILCSYGNDTGKLFECKEFSERVRFELRPESFAVKYDGKPHPATLYWCYNNKGRDDLEWFVIEDFFNDWPDGTFSVYWYPEPNWVSPFWYEGINGTEYDSYDPPTEPGTYQASVGVSINYEGCYILRTNFRIITIGENEPIDVFVPMTVTGKTATVSYKKLKKKNQTVKVSEVLKVKHARGPKTYKKLSGNKKITINSKTGKVTVKKGLKKGTYKVKVRVTSTANSRDWIAADATFKIKVK